MGPWLARRRRAGAWAIAFGNAFVLAGLAATVVEMLAGVRIINNLSIFGLALSVLGPAAAWQLAGRYGRARRKVLLCAVVAAAPLAILAVLALKDQPDLAASGGAFVSYIVVSWAGLLIGLVAGAAVPAEPA